MNNKQQYDKNYEKSHYGKFTIRIKKPYDDMVKDIAKDLNKSVNEYMVDLVMADLKRRKY